MVDFPTYAKPLTEGFRSTRASAVQRTDMESGPPKQLKTRSRVMVTRTVTYKLASLADFNSFIVWFQDTVNFGADWFNWVDPVDSVVKSARIVGGISEEEPADGLPTFWKVKLNIEFWSSDPPVQLAITQQLPGGGGEAVDQMEGLSDDVTVYD